MDSIDFEAWEVDSASGRAVHASGFNLTVEGDLSDPSSVSPANYPEGLSPVDQARLLRFGMQALASAPGTRPAVTPRVNSRAQQAEHNARLFAERKDRPERPKLSLKKPG